MNQAVHSSGLVMRGMVSDSVAARLALLLMARCLAGLCGTVLPAPSTASAAAVAPTPAAAVVAPDAGKGSYDVGVDYHAYGQDFLHTAFVTIYHQPQVRQTVLDQLQGIADRGATVISTRIWFVTEPGTDSFGHTWRATFPISSQEQANLRAYAQDVAAIRGSGGNRLRMDICFLWLGAADYLMGSPTTGLGYSSLSAAEFTRRVQLTTDNVLAAIGDVTRPDGVRLVDTIYLDGEVMIGAKANQEWFLAAHYPRFVSVVSQAGFRPALYFMVGDTQDHVLEDNYVDALYPVLNGHRSMYWVYRTLKFMVDQGMFMPSRIDFSYYVPSTGATYPELLTRVLNDADATLPSLGAPRSYGVAETYYYPDDAQRRQFGHAFAAEATSHDRLHRVCFWTTPDGGGSGVNIAYPFAVEDYLLLAVPFDFDSDLKSDILWRHATRGEVWLWPMDGATRPSEDYVRTVADTNWEIRGVGDQTGDGTADILWRNKVNGQIYFWPMYGSTPQDEIYVATAEPAYDIVGTGDFNGDGRTDILWRNPTVGDVWIWLMDGATPLSQMYVDSVGPGYAIEGVGDLDGDGKADIVWHGVAGDVWVWLMSGTTRVSQNYVGTVPDTHYQIQQVADFDGNGQADLLWWNTAHGDVWIWPMSGATRLAETYVATVPDTNYRIVGAGDYNGDMMADILWHHATRGEVWVWLMDGTTTLSENYVGIVPDVGYQIVR